MGEHSLSRFPATVAAVLLVAMVIIEIQLLLGLSPDFRSRLPYPVDKAISCTSLALGLLGAYALSRNSATGAYFALLNSVLEVVSASFFLLKVFAAPQVNLAQMVSAVALSALGFCVIVCIFSAGFDRQRLTTATSSDPEPLDRENGPVVSGMYALETIDVMKRYHLGPNIVSAVDGVNMKVRKGEFVAIMGPSGSGKSTLLNLIGALDKPSSGTVLIDGIDISRLDDTGLATLRNEKIGFVFQAYNLIARSTVLRNMELPALVKGYPREERLDRISDILGVVGLGDKVLRKPKTLSGGEQQRVAIARALVNDPEIILADEPTGNVDSKTGQVIVGFLRKLNLEKRTTVIVVTHDHEVAKMAERILYLRDGKITGEEIVGRLLK